MDRVRGCLVVTAVAIAFALLAACGDDTSASEKVCDDRDELRAAANTVQEDVSAGNFGQAQDNLSDVQDSYDQLKEDVADLAQQEKEELQPQVDDLATTFAALRDAQSLEEIGTIFETLGSELDTIYSQISSTLDC